jgi:hypothetical protein
VRRICGWDGKTLTAEQLAACARQAYDTDLADVPSAFTTSSIDALPAIFARIASGV